jgi:hypothetical protein
MYIRLMNEGAEFEQKRVLEIIDDPVFYENAPAQARPGSDEYYLGEDSTRAEHILTHLPDIKAALSAHGKPADEINTFRELLPRLCEIPFKDNVDIGEDPSTGCQLIYDRDTGIIISLRGKATDWERKKGIKTPSHPYIVTVLGVESNEDALRYFGKRTGGKLQ